MKASLLFSCIILTGLLACGGPDPVENIDCLPPNLQNGVLAFYPFQNGSLVDESGNGHGLSNTTTAKPAADRAGNPDCAFQFTATPNAPEFLSTPKTGFLNNLSSFSIALWYQPIDDTRPGGSFEALVSRGDAGHCPDRHGEWSVSLYDCRRAVFGHNNSVWADMITNPFTTCESEVKALTGIWHHVVATYNNNSYKIYFNGVLNESVAGIANCTTPYTAQDIGDLFIGKTYTGKIDDVLIYNRELSAQDVMDLYNTVPCCQ